MSSRENMRAQFHLGVTNFNALVDGWEDVEDNLRFMLGGAVIAAWTAFEVLAEDLWVSCVNSRLQLAFIAMGVQPEQDDDAEVAERKRRAVFPFPFSKLNDPNFDVRKGMGSLLRDSGKWKFDRRIYAADAYAKTFRGSEAELEAIFEDDKLQWLSQCRNALVHDAGIAKAEFKRMMTSHLELKNIEVGQRIPLDGPLVSSMIAIAIERRRVCSLLPTSG